MTWRQWSKQPDWRALLWSHKQAAVPLQLHTPPGIRNGSIALSSTDASPGPSVRGMPVEAAR